MKFDFIIGNPPYQEEDGGKGASAKPVYQLFVRQAKQMNPESLCMITPARWYSGGKGLDAFRKEMLSDNHIRKLVDYFNATDCFPTMDISGGVCYFLWDMNSVGDCKIWTVRNGKISKMERNLLEDGEDVFIRFNEAVSIVRKIKSQKEESFCTEISARKPFGLETTVKINYRQNENTIPIYAYPKNGYINRDRISKNSEWIDKYKVCISYAYGERGDFPYLVIGKPFVANPGSCCTETYLVIRAVNEISEAHNIISYMTTRFFRFLVLLKKNTQHATKNVYQLVPQQDFKEEWSDEKLYKKYRLTQDEIRFIELHVREMVNNG